MTAPRVGDIVRFAADDKIDNATGSIAVVRAVHRIEVDGEEDYQMLLNFIVPIGSLPLDRPDHRYLVSLRRPEVICRVEDVDEA